MGDSLEEFLVSATQDAKLRQLMMSMSEAIRTIAFKVSGCPDCRRRAAAAAPSAAVRKDALGFRSAISGKKPAKSKQCEECHEHFLQTRKL